MPRLTIDGEPAPLLVETRSGALVIIDIQPDFSSLAASAKRQATLGRSPRAPDAG